MLEDQVGISGSNRFVIGGNFNANVRRGNARRGVWDKYGVGRMNDAERDLSEWCEEHEVIYMNS